MKMKFIEERFPDDISYGSFGGPQYSASIVCGASGFEQRNTNWSEPKGVYNVAHGIKTEAQWQKLLSFFRVCMGRAIGFRFKDWSDYKTKGEIIGIGDGISREFQLKKSYSINNTNSKEVRTICKPVAGSVKVYCAGIEYKEVSIDSKNGHIFFDTPPKNQILITADFEFDIPARFDTDHLSASIDASGMHYWNNIPIVEIRIGSAGNHSKIG